MIWQSLPAISRREEIPTPQESHRKMKEEQALLSLSHFAVTGHFTDFRNAAALVSPAEALQVLVAYTPLLTPSSQLLFVHEIANQALKSPTDLMDSVPPTSSLHLAIDVSPEVVEERCRAVRAHVATECDTYLFDAEAEDLLLEFVEAHTRRTDIHVALAYDDELFTLVQDKDEFQQWWNTVLVPYRYFNDKGGSTDLISFESYASSASKKAVDIFGILTTRGIDQLEPPYVQFLKSTEKTTLLDFIQELSVVDDVSTITSLRLFNKIVTLLFPSSEFKEESLKLIIDIYESYPQPTAETLSSISSTLSLLSNSTSDTHTRDLVNAVNAAKSYPLEFTSLSELTALSKDAQKQEQFFEKVIDSLTPQTASRFLSQTTVLKPALFPNISEESTRKIVMSRFLSLRLYSEIQFSQEDEDIVVDHFWTCFKTATNGSKDRGELNAGYRVLQTVKNPSVKITNLLKFVDAVDELFDYSIYFQRGTPLRPNDLLTIEDFSVVARKLLELNPSAYQSPTKLYTLLANLSIALHATLPSITDVTCLCIDSSLVQDDFTFAYTETMRLFSELSHSELESKWDSFFQVAKYVSPEWIETQTPEQIIHDQMTLLSNILKVAPIKHSQIIISQWKSLDLELSLRDDEDKNQVVDQQPRSLDQRLANALSTTAGELLKDGKSGQMTNLLANGLGWAMGGRQ